MRSRFYDLRDSNRKWEVATGYLDRVIVTSDGEKISAVNLPGASLCADFLVHRKTGIWAGITVAIHERDYNLIESIFGLATSPIVNLIPLGGGVALPRYRDFPEVGWLEINWLAERNVDMAPALTNQALWYTVLCPETRMQRVVLLALEDLDYMLKEGPQGMRLPNL